MSTAGTGFSLEQAYEGLTAARSGGHADSCRSPTYKGPDADDSDDDGASDYASHGRQRLLRPTAARHHFSDHHDDDDHEQ